MSDHKLINVHFSDYFDVPPNAIEEAGAFNISLINDLPLFIDPFLLFNSKKPEYQELHEEIIRYLRFLRDKSLKGEVGFGLLGAWYTFSEVKQTWLGFSEVGNKGRGLGSDFASALNRNLHTLFANFGDEKVTLGSHLEKLCLIRVGVGKDSISDFTTNLIKEYILKYTQAFTADHISKEYRKIVVVEKVRFNYVTESWESDEYDLPYYDGDYILLTPKDILTKDDIWINKQDLLNDYDRIADSIPNNQLRDQINNYFMQVLPIEPSEKDKKHAATQVIIRFPELLEYYIKYKEENGDIAKAISEVKVSEVEDQFIHQLRYFINGLASRTEFYSYGADTFEETKQRVEFLKRFIEYQGGYRLFYVDGKPIKREKDLQLLFRLTWFGTPSDVSREVDDGRGPADFKISRGSFDKTIVEFKLAKNAQLRRNLVNQLALYQKASETRKGLKVIVYFSQSELIRVRNILSDLGMSTDANIILIDARNDNKPSASKATSI